MAIAPNDANLLYSPGNWDVQASYARTINPGAYIRFAAQATSITMNFDTSNLTGSYPILKYRVDQGGWQTVTLAASIALTIPSNGWAVHTVEFVVASTSEQVANRWNPMTAHVTVQNIDLGTGTLVTTLPKPKKGLMFGDSITEGYRSISSATDPSGSDNTAAWSFKMGEYVGAEIGIIGFGGQGWTNSGVGAVPQLTTSWNQITNGVTRSFTGIDFICVNMGENGSVDQATVTSWLTSLVAAIPSTCKVFVLRPFSGRNGSTIQAGVAALNNTQVMFVDTSGWWTSNEASDSQHPYGSAARIITPRLAAIVQTAVAGGTVQTAPVAYYRRGSDGQAVPVAMGKKV